MPRYITGPDGKTHQFPDDAKDTEISRALQAIPSGNAPPQSKARTWTDMAVDTLPMAGGALGGLIGAAGGTVAGMGVGGVPGGIGGAALGGAAGESAKQLINRARGAAAPATPAAAAGDIGLSAAANAAAEGAGSLVVGPLMKKGGEILMSSALKPGIKSTVAQFKRGATVPKVVQTLLDEGINVTQGGLLKLQDILNSTNAQIKAMVANTAGTAPKTRIASEVANTAMQTAKQAAPQGDLRAIGGVVEDFLDHPLYGAEMTVPEMQSAKQATYRAIGDKYGTESAAAVEAQKALARGFKNEIEHFAPETKALNARQGKAIEAADAVAKRVAQDYNKNPAGFAFVAHSPQTFIAALMDKSPAVKSLLARGLYSSAAKAAQVSPQLIRAAIQAIATHEDQDE